MVNDGQHMYCYIGDVVQQSKAGLVCDPFKNIACMMSDDLHKISTISGWNSSFSRTSSETFYSLRYLILFCFDGILHHGQ